MIKFFLWMTLFVGAATALLVGTTPDVRILKTQFPVMERSADKTYRVRWMKQRPAHWVRLAEISPYARGAVIVSEDWSFYHHPGVDTAEFFKMLRQSLEYGERLRGASTLTQQLAKNVFLNQDRNLLRKARELFVALALETTFTKSEILEAYFNVVEWGDGIYGVRRAAQVYFEKSPAALGPREAAFLAMLLPNPRGYSESFRRRELSPFAQRITNQILRKMHIGGYITAEELDEALQERLAFERWVPIEPIKQSEMTEAIESIKPIEPMEPTEPTEPAGSIELPEAPEPTVPLE